MGTYNTLSNKTPLWEEVDDIYDPSREWMRRGVDHSKAEVHIK